MRRMLVAVLGVTIALLGAAAPAQAADGPALTVPNATLDAALTCTDGPSDVDPVLLIPGTAETPEPNFSWNYMRVFAAEGRSFCAVELPAAGLVDIQVSAEYVVHALRTMHARYGGKVDVVGHSQGGMITRWPLKYWPDTRTIVDDLVGLAPSNHGTVDAAAICAAPCAPSIQQQRLGSQFLTALNTGPETWSEVDYTVVYTRLDEIVLPASSALLQGDGDITNVAVQDVCPARVADHLTVGTSDAVGYALAADALDNPGPADPARVDRGVCGQLLMPGVDPLTFATDLAGLTTTIATSIAVGPKTFAEPPLAAYAR